MHTAIYIEYRLKEPLPPRPDTNGLHAQAFVKSDVDVERERRRRRARGEKSTLPASHYKDGELGPDIQICLGSRLSNGLSSKLLLHRFEQFAYFPFIKYNRWRLLEKMVVHLGDLLQTSSFIMDKVSHGMMLVMVNNRPKSRGCLHLTNNDPFQHATIKLNLLSNDEDAEAFLWAAKQVRKIATHSPFADLIEEEERPGPSVQTDDEIRQWIHTRATTTWHYSGTCRMGNTSRQKKLGDCVCDNELRVFGVRGLRVADASVMPIVVTGNTNSACMMIGDKCGEFILSDEMVELANEVSNLEG